MAYKVSSQLRAYYHHVYEGLDEAPGLNPLAVLRWKHRTQEQKEAKKKWEKQQKHSPSKSRSSNGLEGYGSPGSSMSVQSRPSQERQSSQSPDEPAGWWRYSVHDIVAYNDAGGVVNYFIPPRRKLDCPSPAESVNPSRATTPQPHQQPEPHEEIRSDISASDRKSAGGRARVTSASTTSFGSHPASQESAITPNRDGHPSKVSPNDLAKHHREHRAGCPIPMYESSLTD